MHGAADGCYGAACSPNTATAAKTAEFRTKSDSGHTECAQGTGCAVRAGAGSVNAHTVPGGAESQGAHAAPRAETSTERFPACACGKTSDGSGGAVQGAGGAMAAGAGGARALYASTGCPRSQGALRRAIYSRRAPGPLRRAIYNWRTSDCGCTRHVRAGVNCDTLPRRTDTTWQICGCYSEC